MNEMINDLNKIKEKYNKNAEILDESYSNKIDENMSNVIEDINNYKRNIEKEEEYEFLYEENELNNILDKIKGFGEINKKSDYLFKWKTGQNYILSQNNLIATKTSGGNNYNCNILGDIILPKNKISKWKIKLKKFNMSSQNVWDILIGVGPSNLNQNEENLYGKTWTFLCGDSRISIKSGSGKEYIKEQKKLKEGDIIEVIMNNINGELSFAVNDTNYGVACKIPLNIDLSPFILIYDQGESIELIK